MNQSTKYAKTSQLMGGSNQTATTTRTSATTVAMTGAAAESDIEQGQASKATQQASADLLRKSGISKIHLIDLDTSTHNDITNNNDGFSTFQEGDTAQQHDNASTSTGSDSITRVGGQRKILFALLIFLVGALASAAFLSIGIINAKQDQTDQFGRLASEFVVKLQDAFKDYELFGLWIHESCRARRRRRDGSTTTSRNASDNVLGICSREDFHELYEYILSVGLDFQSAQFMPFVSHDQREDVEAESRSFYQENYPHVNYRGIVGLFINDEGVKVEPQDEEDFYWPVHYIEPVVGNEAAIELDLYSSPTQQKTIQHAVSSWLPSVTDRLKLVQEKEPNAYSIILHHPGIPLSKQNATRDKPNAISLMVIRIPALLARTNVDATDTASYYIYDATHADKDPGFLGAHTAYAQPHGAVTFGSLPETSLADLEANVDTRLELRKVAIADREWIIAVVALPDTYVPEVAIVVVGGVVILLASLLLSAFLWLHLTRVGKVNAIKAQAAEEKAEFIVQTARQQALAERQLNEYIAHEVRNPLSSAIAALSFVNAAAKEPTQTAEEKKVMLDDLHIIDSSLQFINELLRNMLDMHRAANQQMKITMAPTDLLRDVMEPVASILYLRGNKVEIITECPQNFVVISDRLRLKQIVLNLAMNATKFVEKGFIRLRCVLADNGTGSQSVQIHLEDSGPGIPPEKRQNLFAKFQESLDLLNQGTGIGLCLCKHLTNLMQGELWLDETYNSGVEGCPGSRFVIDLRTAPLDDAFWDESQSMQEHDHAFALTPAKSSQSESTPKPVETTSPASVEDGIARDLADDEREETGNCSTQALKVLESGRQSPQPTGTKQHNINHIPRELPENLKVLFTDDDMMLRKLFSRSLRRVAPGWDVQEAANGETALHMVGDEKKRFDVIFLDQYMSAIEKQLLGTETARALRAKGVTSRICGLSANDAEVPFLEAGADVFLFKPFPCEKEALKRALLDVIYGPSKRIQKADSYQA